MYLMCFLAAIRMELGSEEKPSLPVHIPHQMALSLAAIVEQAMGGSSGAVSRVDSGNLQTPHAASRGLEATPVKIEFSASTVPCLLSFFQENRNPLFPHEPIVRVIVSSTCRKSKI